ncbi:MAG: tellurite resistance TerB family protein [Thiohalocapsa sp.]
MALKDMLDQMLAAGRDLATQGQAYAEEKLQIPSEGPERDTALSNLGKGALAGGALTLLLGTGAGRKLAGTAAALGGLGALGKVAYDAFQTWQNDQTSAGQLSVMQQTGTPIGELSNDAAEQRSRALFRAMIAAAKADGHIDAAERAAIQDASVQIGLDDDTRLMLEAELARPLDAAEIAAGADSPEAAAEIYLASLFVIDLDQPIERAYLDQLAVALNLQPGLARQLEAQAQAA